MALFDKLNRKLEILMKDIRNVAIVAHVDHGKTTLVDELLKQSGTFRENQQVQERVMDSNDLERERGITILSKNTSINYNDTKINIVDTPGHADFGGEVERVLKMVNGVILVVDAFEGVMPQTKFVLKNALDLDLSLIICLNKIDRDGIRIEEVEEEILELLIELGASDSQLEAPFVYASAKSGFATSDINVKTDNMKDLFDTIIDYIPAPKKDFKGNLQMLITTLEFNEYVGQIGIGKIESGTLKTDKEVAIVNVNNGESIKKCKVTKLYEFSGLGKEEVKECRAGSIVGICLSEKINIGDTITSVDNPQGIEFNEISKPTVAMTFSVNDSPFAGKEGKYLTSRHLRTRLFKELNTDVSLEVQETDTTEAFKVIGRGELHLSILIENLRREGFELQVSKPEVIFKDIDGVKCEPLEEVTIDVAEEYVGNVIEKMGTRKGEMTYMTSFGEGYSRVKFLVPSRGLIGYRGEFLTDTRGTGVLNSIFDSYVPYKGEIQTRPQGSLISFENGKTTAYGLYNAQERGTLFIDPGVDVYTGMVIGKSSRAKDLEVNVCKKKQLTNVRSSSSDDALTLSPPQTLSLEQSLEYINDDELLEITPTSIRIRKKILNASQRIKAQRRKEKDV
ncbi:MAG: translational GTPase TypA [Bacilli bacterium]